MHKKVFRIIFCLLLTFSIIILPGCKEKDGSGYLFKYSLSDDPKNLDPQFSTDTPAMIVMGNLYCGLLKIADNGNLTEGVATNYEVSADGLTYTFTLREDNYWVGKDSDFKEKVTAKDFVFAFQRIFNKSTISPYSDDFKCIKNAEKILSGQGDVSSLGVTAINDFTLKIELDYQNAHFLTLLTTPAASPCNKDFFESTKGKYGLDADDIIGNGPFYVKQWQYDPYGKNNFLILRKNKFYSETETIYPSSINFFIQKDTKQLIKDFYNGSTDCAVVGGDEKKALSGSYSINEYETSSLGLVFSSKSELINNPYLKKALSLSINREQFKEKLPKGLTPAYAIVPGGITMLNKSYRELVAEKDKSVYNPEEAKNNWQEGLSRNNIASLDGINILVSEDFKNTDSLKNITQQWQNELNFFCGVEVVPEKEYLKKIKNGDYDIALYKLNASFNNPVEILNNFQSGNSKNVFNYSNSGVDGLINKSEHSESLSDCVKYYNQAETLILSDYQYIPIFYQKQYLVYDKKMSDINYNPFTKQIYFINAKNFD